MKTKKIYDDFRKNFWSNRFPKILIILLLSAIVNRCEDAIVLHDILFIYGNFIYTT